MVYYEKTASVVRSLDHAKRKHKVGQIRLSEPSRRTWVEQRKASELLGTISPEEVEWIETGNGGAGRCDWLRKKENDL